MTRERVWKKPPRYAFLLNPYSDTRLSKCSKCDRPTHPRKFALLIHADGWGPLALGKTCRYCSRCELVIAHKDELDAEMAHNLSKIAPAAVGGKYLVLGTVDRKVWQRGLRGESVRDEVMDHVSEFEKVLQLEVERGGWRRAGQ